MGRDLRISADVAQLLPAGVLGQLQATIDDPDNICCVCEELISGPSAEVVIFTDRKAATLVKLAHSGCMRSGVRVTPRLREAIDAHAQESDGFAMATKLGLRVSKPRALIFLEPEVLTGGIDEDPLELYSEALGLVPIAGLIEDIELVATDQFSIELIEGGLGLCAAHGLEVVPAEASDLTKWLGAAEGRAVVIVARGLGLRRPRPTIGEALALRPSWGAIAEVASGTS